MKTKINDAIRQVLEQFGDKYFIEEQVNKSKVIQDLDGYDAPLLEAFITNETIKNNFTIDIAGNLVMQTNKLIELFEADEYWQDSYTKYSKKIGLTAGGKFIDESTDVVLDFPYKDTVLKASMSKEDTDKDDLRPDEPFLNEVIAKEEIDVLLDKKILVNAKKYDENGVHDIDSFDENDNLIMKGNNLLALHTLMERYAGKVKMIYIDPPYNTGNDSFKYNDKFNRSTWLTFMKNRLEIAHSLLSRDGSIVIQIDHNEQAYLKVLLDEVFGVDNFINQIVWQRSSSGKTISKNLPSDLDYLLWYSKSEDYMFNPVFKPLSEATRKMYNKNDNDGRGFYRLYPLQKTGSPGPQTTYDYIDNEGKVWKCPAKGWRMNKHKLKELENDNRLYKKGNSLSEKAYWDERENKGRLSNNLWDDIYNLQGSNSEMVGFSGQKPEKLISRVIEMTTNPNDIICDFHLGSGSTSAVAHKMNRRYIGIEQMDYINTVSVPRLQKVIEGEQGGISKDVEWQGGGSFVYVELMEKNRGFLTSVQNAKTTTELQEVFTFMLEEAEIDFRVDLEAVKDTLGELSLNDQKKTLIKIIDKNQLYYNYSEIDDENVRDLIDDNDYSFNKSFYSEGDE
jgi:adenine-specific DNA-methyltransferase